MDNKELKDQLNQLSHGLKPQTGKDWADYWFENQDMLRLADMFDLAMKVAENRGRMGL
jgi:hypothetical protein